MDTVKIGEFLRTLRKEKCLTQAQLGEKIGVTNKTISRWESGAYLPSVDMLKILSEEFDITINEILNGERLDTESFKEAAEENLAEALESAFTMKEIFEFWRKKWYRDNLFSIIVSVIIFIMLLTYSQIKSNIYVEVFSFAYPFAVEIIFYNKKMSYIERHTYCKGKV